MRIAPVAALAALALSVAGCAGMSDGPHPPLALADRVDLPRFMGDWYVIAAIPTFLEKDAYNPMDHYRLDPDGTIATTYTFNAGGFDGPARSYRSRGFVRDPGRNAVWGQQYVWPIEADYRIAYLSSDYREVVIAREKRDYVWIMARTPTIAAADYERLKDFVAAQGYDVGKLQRAPQAGAR